jgi:hypothetical protein
VDWRLGPLVALFAIAGPGRQRPARTVPVGGGEERVARELVTRLAVLGGLRAPRVVIEQERTPLTWTTALPRRTPTIHVTAGLTAA